MWLGASRDDAALIASDVRENFTQQFDGIRRCFEWPGGWGKMKGHRMTQLVCRAKQTMNRLRINITYFVTMTIIPKPY